MRFYALLPTVLATGAIATTLSAQAGGRGNQSFYYSSLDSPRAVIGLSTTSAATSRDTLGVLVSTVRSGSPADKAGIEEGNRIASINGISLKLGAADVGDDEMAGALSRRLSRELDKLKPGDEVDLHVYAGGQTKTVKVKTVSPDDLYTSMRATKVDDRPTLGLSFAITGNPRDTLGVFVMSAEDAGPAGKAGIEEGSRIASINGIDVRSTRSPDDDNMIVYRSTNVNRLEREISRLKPGETADLHVYHSGQYRDVKVTVGRMSDLPHRAPRMTIIGGDNMISPMIAGTFDGREIGDQIRRSLETARIATSNVMDGVGQGLGRVLGRLGNRLEW